MGNSPVNGVDPDGQFWNFIAGAVLGGFGGYQIGKSQGAKGWGLAGYIFSGAAIGTVTAGIGSSVASATASWGIVGSGIASGAAAGFTGGFYNSALAGNSNPLQAGLKGAAWGGAIGGVTGAIFKGKTHEDISDLRDDLNGSLVESVDEFSEKYFSGAKNSYDLKYNIASEDNIPKGYKFDKDLQSIYRASKSGKQYINGIHQPSLFGKNNLWLSPRLLTNDKQLFRTLGHELIHGWHNSITPLWEKGGSNYMNLTESVAHNWSLHQGVSLGVKFSSSSQYFHQFYRQLSVNQIFKYNNSYHWKLNSIFNNYR